MSLTAPLRQREEVYCVDKNLLVMTDMAESTGFFPEDSLCKFTYCLQLS